MDSTSSSGTGSDVKVKLHHAAQGVELFALIVDAFRIDFERFKIVCAHCLLQCIDGFGIEEMRFTTFAPLVFATDRQGVAVRRPFWESFLVANFNFFGNSAQGCALNACWACP